MTILFLNVLEGFILPQLIPFVIDRTSLSDIHAYPSAVLCCSPNLKCRYDLRPIESNSVDRPKIQKQSLL